MARKDPATLRWLQNIGRPNAYNLLITPTPVEPGWGLTSLQMAIRDKRTCIYDDDAHPHMTNIGALRFNRITGEVYNIENPECTIMTVPARKLDMISKLIDARYRQDHMATQSRTTSQIINQHIARVKSLGH